MKRLNLDENDDWKVVMLGLERDLRQSGKDRIVQLSLAQLVLLAAERSSPIKGIDNLMCNFQLSPSVPVLCVNNEHQLI